MRANYASYVNKWMRRDVKRRALVKEYNNERIRLNAVRKNKILPKELQVKFVSSIVKKYSIWLRMAIVVYRPNRFYLRT